MGASFSFTNEEIRVIKFALMELRRKAQETDVFINALRSEPANVSGKEQRIIKSAIGKLNEARRWTANAVPGAKKPTFRKGNQDFYHPVLQHVVEHKCTFHNSRWAGHRVAAPNPMSDNSVLYTYLCCECFGVMFGDKAKEICGEQGDEQQN